MPADRLRRTSDNVRPEGRKEQQMTEPSAPGAGRESIAARYREIRSDTEVLAAPLTGEDQTVQTMPDVSPTKWHRAHTTWFFETFVVMPRRPAYEPFHPQFGYL